MSTYSIAKYVAGLAAALLLASVVQSVGCNPTLQGEGSRCNPDLASGEGDCNSGLTCTQPSLCPENYCCPVDSSGNPAPSSNPFCQTGCSGGAASRCNAGVDTAGECAFACANDPGDLLNPSICATLPDGGADAGDSGGAGDTGAIDGGGSDVAKDGATVDAGGDGARDASGDAAGDVGSDAAGDASDGAVTD